MTRISHATRAERMAHEAQYERENLEALQQAHADYTAAAERDRKAEVNDG